MKESAPWFKFFPDRWLSSVTVNGMTAEERGVYINLLALSWRDGGIHESELDKITRCLKVDLKCTLSVLELAFTKDGEVWKNGVQEELRCAKEKQREANARGGSRPKRRKKTGVSSGLKVDSKSTPSNRERREGEGEGEGEKRVIKEKHSVGLETDAETIYNFYKSNVRPGAKADAVNSITKRLKEGYTAEELKAAIETYMKSPSWKDDPEFRIQANNFFGKAERFRDFTGVQASESFMASAQSPYPRRTPKEQERINEILRELRDQEATLKDERGMGLATYQYGENWEERILRGEIDI